MGRAKCLGRGNVLSAWQLFVSIVSLQRHWLEIPDDADPRKQLQEIIGNIDFPPVKSLACAAHMLMMVIVPAFAESDESEPKVVAALVSRFIAFVPEQVGQ